MLGRRVDCRHECLCLLLLNQPLPAPLRPAADYALAHPHTYLVTMRQLLAWVQNPVPAGQLTAQALGCGRPGGAGPEA